MSVKHTRLGLAAIILAVVAVDQATKLLVSSQMGLGQSIPVVPGLLHITLVRNTGMAFGLLSAHAIPYKPFLVTLLSVIALSAVAIYAIRAHPHERLSRFGLAFILGGAAGNIIDRIRLGYVIDFIDVFYRGSHWPAFNVADTAICTGVGLLLLDTLLHRESKKATAPTGASEI
jgi:signal peptidase II